MIGQMSCSVTALYNASPGPFPLRSILYQVTDESTWGWFPISCSANSLTTEQGAKPPVRQLFWVDRAEQIAEQAVHAGFFPRLPPGVSQKGKKASEQRQARLLPVLTAEAPEDGLRRREDRE